MTGGFHRQWLAPLAVCAGYLLLLTLNPVRLSLLDGARALRRYHRLWMIPASLGACYALFQAAVALFFLLVLPIEQRPAFGWKIAWAIPPAPARAGEIHSLGDWVSVVWQDPQWGAARAAALDGMEAVAGLFNNVVTTFPVSAIAALLLLFNWEDHHRTLGRALRKRFGKRGIAAHSAIIACAVSAVIAPVLFGPSLLYLNRAVPGLLLIRWAAVIDWLSSMFAYLFGVGAQVYLILLVYTWLRGLTWTPVHLLDMAIRRFSFVVKWAAVVLAVSSLLIDLPRIAALLFRFDDPVFVDRTLAYTDHIGRPLLALFLIFFAAMQTTLTFHSETLAKAMAHNLQFLRRFAWQFCWFLLIAAVHLFGLAWVNDMLLLGFGGEYTSAGLIWSFVRPLLGAVIAGWLLASWVSLYKRCETGRVSAPEWIRF
jgi:hypothetical protein